MSRQFPVIYLTLSAFLLVLIFYPRPSLRPASPAPSLPSPTPVPFPTVTSTPTPKPLTFAQRNALSGPCAYLPVLFYHHIQTPAAAAASHQSSLTVYTDVFAGQMQYLADRGYTPITPGRLDDFFDHSVPLPSKAVLLTFDDGYVDFYTDAAPILKAHNFPAVMFLPTGLVQNPDYLTWDQVSRLSSSVYFANHTWSHASLYTNLAVLSREVDTAQTQLADHGLNPLKVFAYPYGTAPPPAVNYLARHGYSLAFTTQYGLYQCARLRLTLPRIRVANVPLSRYGL